MARVFRRSIFWLVPVIVIPLAALVVIQYRFLRSLETKTISAERGDEREATGLRSGGRGRRDRVGHWFLQVIGQ